MEEERQNDDDVEGEARGATGRALAPVSKHSQARRCSITVDPTDDIIVHISTKCGVVTLTTTAIAVASQCCRAQVEEPTGRGSVDMSSIRTKVWSSLEVNSNDAVLVGAGVSGDVHLGHILSARLFNGTIEAVNLTATRCLYEASEQINVKSEELKYRKVSRNFDRGGGGDARPAEVVELEHLFCSLVTFLCEEGNDDGTGVAQNNVPCNERMVPSPSHPSSFGAAVGNDYKRRTPPPHLDKNGRRGGIGGSAVLDRCQFDVR